MYIENQLLPLSALQHYLVCPRQTALIHLEQTWAENRFTAEGRGMHENAHSGDHESRPGIRITRTLPVVSLKLGLSGQCDIVEFNSNGTVTPIEYKRGKPKSHRADEVQLCAQALCLEEMLQCKIEQAFLFYGKRKRRYEVVFDAELRALTEQTAQAFHDLIKSRKTPIADYEARKCDACSLIDHCQPWAFRLKRGAAAWFADSLAITHQITSTRESCA
ncbi:CRISPR-associated protein Cas4 [Verrucomicrobia bacterium]|nr:CRISPR-associated protein Cas4 [Verrucomicrobiota bacterium]